MKRFSEASQAALNGWSDQFYMTGDFSFATKFKVAAVGAMSLGSCQEIMTYITVFQPADGDIVKADIEENYTLRTGPGGWEVFIK